MSLHVASCSLGSNEECRRFSDMFDSQPVCCFPAQGNAKFIEGSGRLTDAGRPFLRPGFTAINGGSLAFDGSGLWGRIRLSGSQEGVGCKVGHRRWPVVVSGGSIG
ncbi:hypothetical protein Nepgr_032032 [Nepenthes gracilis]|uniref:Uncharacterized protein n=1 Tax=Nepenthes gracilis TaxID=150966 RepID=A0AAD3TJ75_NEPGR|nr:hypothetical protein Nepgr_032032 [Nepenthes gracilis]